MHSSKLFMHTCQGCWFGSDYCHLGWHGVTLMRHSFRCEFPDDTYFFLSTKINISEYSKFQTENMIILVYYLVKVRFERLIEMSGIPGYRHCSEWFRDGLSSDLWKTKDNTCPCWNPERLAVSPANNLTNSRHTVSRWLSWPLSRHCVIWPSQYHRHLSVTAIHRPRGSLCLNAWRAFCTL